MNVNCILLTTDTGKATKHSECDHTTYQRPVQQVFISYD